MIIKLLEFLTLDEVTHECVWQWNIKYQISRPAPAPATIQQMTCQQYRWSRVKLCGISDRAGRPASHLVSYWSTWTQSLPLIGWILQWQAHWKSPGHTLSEMLTCVICKIYVPALIPIVSIIQFRVLLAILNWKDRWRHIPLSIATEPRGAQTKYFKYFNFEPTLCFTTISVYIIVISNSKVKLK